MEDIRIIIKNAITSAIKGIDSNLEVEIPLEVPAIRAFGDYASPVSMNIFKDIKDKIGEKSPLELAQSISKKLRGNDVLKDFVEKIDVVKPGFINFHLANATLLSELERVIKEADKYGSSKLGEGKTVVIDYSGPNIAKRFSIGHLRSTIIGQALYNLYKFSGWKVIGDNHLGDWGTQFGKMIVAIRKWSLKPAYELSVDEMEKLYVKFHDEMDVYPDLIDAARQAFKALENGGREEREIWEHLISASMRDFQKIYDLLNVQIDFAYGESFYEKMMPKVIEEAKKKKIAVESEGALIVSFPDSKLPPGMLLKSDGASTYFTRDLATIKYRIEEWNPELIVYEVGTEQSLHFEQVFSAAALLGWIKRQNLRHIPHGLITLKEGKMSTRKGRTIKLEQVLDEIIKRAGKFNENEQVAKSVGVGALKYNDLKRSPTSGYLFNWEEALSLDGNSGPYIQYTHARCKSVLTKAGEINYMVNKGINLNKEEASILKYVSQFRDIISKSVENHSPNYLCTFLFELSQRFNIFYNKHSILSAKTESDKEFRLLLTKAVAQVLSNGLELLGVDALDEM